MFIHQEVGTISTEFTEEISTLGCRLATVVIHSLTPTFRSVTVHYKSSDNSFTTEIGRGHAEQIHGDNTCNCIVYWDKKDYMRITITDSLVEDGVEKLTVVSATVVTRLVDNKYKRLTHKLVKSASLITRVKAWLNGKYYKK